MTKFEEWLHAKVRREMREQDFKAYVNFASSSRFTPPQNVIQGFEDDIRKLKVLEQLAHEEALEAFREEARCPGCDECSPPPATGS